MAEVKKLTKKQLQTLREKLESEKNKLVYMSQNQDEYKVQDEDMRDEVDQANADVANSQAVRFRNREVFYLKKLEKTLKKFDKNEYGTCCECGENIRFERLLARPTAEMCILCKEESERNESNNFYARQSKSLGKAINLVNQL